MFANSLPECKITGYAITTSPEIPSQEGQLALSGSAASVFTINDDKTKFIVNPTQLVSQTFYIVAYTASNKFAALQVQGEVVKTAAPFNLFPVFKKLPSTINIDLTHPADDVNDLWPKDIIIVESGIATDEEGDDVQYIGSKERLPFVSITGQAGTFEIEIDQSKILAPHAGPNEIEIYVSDSGHQEGDF